MTKGQIANKFFGKATHLYYNRPFVYWWLRGNEYLYVGHSQSIHSRISNHSVINEVEPFLETDVIEFEEFTTKSEALSVERSLINGHLPKYNYKPARHRLPEVTPFGREYFRRTSLGLSLDGLFDTEKPTLKEN